MRQYSFIGTDVTLSIAYREIKYKKSLEEIKELNKNLEKAKKEKAKSEHLGELVP